MSQDIHLGAWIVLLCALRQHELLALQQLMRSYRCENAVLAGDALLPEISFLRSRAFECTS